MALSGRKRGGRQWCLMAAKGLIYKTIAYMYFPYTIVLFNIISIIFFIAWSGENSFWLFDKMIISSSQYCLGLNGPIEKYQILMFYVFWESLCH